MYEQSIRRAVERQEAMDSGSAALVRPGTWPAFRIELAVRYMTLRSWRSMKDKGLLHLGSFRPPSPALTWQERGALVSS